jgi:hypothetical protein
MDAVSPAVNRLELLEERARYVPRVAEPMEWGCCWCSGRRSAALDRSSSLDRTMTLSV